MMRKQKIYFIMLLYILFGMINFMPAHAIRWVGAIEMSSDLWVAHESATPSIDEDDPIWSRSITLSSIQDGSESSLAYMGVGSVLDVLPGNMAGYPGTIVVIDAGLSVSQWHALETNHNDGLMLDIIRYVTLNDAGFIEEYGNYGYDPLYGVSDEDLGYDPAGTNQLHGVRVLSAIEMVARYAPIIYINDGLEDGNGFDNLHQSPIVWQWIYDHADEYDIRVVSMSWLIDDAESQISSSVMSILSQLHDEKNIFMVGAASHDGNYCGSYFPVIHEDVYMVGSIDHEDRGKSFWWGYDEDYFTKKNYYSGASAYAQESLSRFRSGYGLDVAGDANALDFIMPGNGVPVFDTSDSSLRSFEYAKGTSFSTGFVAATALIAIYAYQKGFLDHGGSDTDPTSVLSVQDLYQLMIDATFESSFTMRYGYGHFSVYQVYMDAYDLGANNAPGSGGGGGGGFLVQ